MMKRKFVAAIAALGLLGQFGCDRAKTKKPSPTEVNLRVVMLVELGADLSSPPSNTGGCKLTRNEVIEIVNQLVTFANNAAPGLKFVWNSSNIQQLESSCMELQGFPFPPCTSVCSLPGGTMNCPRRLDTLWFINNVVNHSAGGPAGLQQADAYANDQCTINIYFVGNFVSAVNGSNFEAVTSIPSGAGDDFVLINDQAFTSPTASANAQRIKDLSLLLHEVTCHWLRDTTSHVSVSEGTCPGNLCISGPTYFGCQAQYNNLWPQDVPTAIQNTNVTNLQPCQVTP